MAIKIPNGSKTDEMYIKFTIARHSKIYPNQNFWIENIPYGNTDPARESGFTKCDQGCQIFLDTIYQNEGKYTKLQEHYQMTLKYTK
jgi:hypothetical protein